MVFTERRVEFDYQKEVIRVTQKEYDSCVLVKNHKDGSKYGPYMLHLNWQPFIICLGLAFYQTREDFMTP